MQPEILARRIRDLLLDDEKIQIGTGIRLTARIGTEQNHLQRRMSRRRDSLSRRLDRRLTQHRCIPWNSATFARAPD